MRLTTPNLVLLFLLVFRIHIALARGDGQASRSQHDPRLLLKLLSCACWFFSPAPCTLCVRTCHLVALDLRTGVNHVKARIRQVENASPWKSTNGRIGSRLVWRA
ncbi:hypothetical protein V8C37DRAFT_372820 [Trichoderma ceciliae]